MKLNYRSPWFSAALCSVTFVSLARAQWAATAPTPSCEEAVPEGLTAADWSSIRAAYEAGRHAVVACEDGYRAWNPAQQWLTGFDGRGFTTTPDAGGWAWGLELESLGFQGEERVIEGRAPVHVEGARVAYVWDTTLEEWYENDGRGLEHGYTLHERPTRDGDAEGPLSFTLAVRGGLRAEVQEDGRGVRFLNEDGAAVVTYSGLHVFDAEGQDLPARFEQWAEGLRLIVQEDGARYPLTIDPIAQQAYLKASNTGRSDTFGWSVSVSGDTVVVGAYGEDSNATGVDGDQSNNSAPSAGAAYVFVRNGTTWSQQAYLKASNAQGSDATTAGDLFGWSASVSGDTVIVGALQEDSNATGVNGDQNNNDALNSGAAYVFVRNGTTWSQQAYLKASNTDLNDHFSYSVSVSGDTVVVGAPYAASNFSGAAYVFVRNGTIWSQQAYLTASNAETADAFGVSVSVSGDTVAVGAQYEDSNATGVNGDQNNNDAISSGAAYVFVRNGTAWTQQAYLKASNTEMLDQFGVSVSVSGDTLVVGAWLEGSVDSGAAYVFVRNGTIWSQQAYLKASNTDANDFFGFSVSVSGDTVVVGAHFEDSNATGVDGDQSNNSADAGAAYVFVRNGTTWSQQSYLKASNTDAGDAFGVSVSVSGDTVVVGAFNEDSNATGVDGDQSNDSAPISGAAYVFSECEDPGVAFCFGDGTSGACPCSNPGAPGHGCANSTFPSGALLGACGATNPDTVVLSVTSARPSSLAVFIVAPPPGSGATPFSNGLLCIGPFAGIVQSLVTDGSGNAHTTVSVSAASGTFGGSGDTRQYQVMYVEPGGGPCGPMATRNLSNAYQILW